MKRILFIISTIFIFGACSSTKSVSKAEAQKREGVEIQAEDEGTKYELLTFDSMFDSWYTIHENGIEMRSMEYYMNWNEQYVSDWNTRSMYPSGSKYFTMRLDFNPRDYEDLAFQRKLFYYFQYVETELKLKILYGPSPHVVF